MVNMEPLKERVFRNVWITKMDTQPVERLLIWINATMECEVKALNELCTGAIYCQLLHRMCRKSISLARVRWYTNEHRDFESNFTILRCGFSRIGVTKDVPIKQLTAGRGHFEFINWFYKFYNTNRSIGEYHPKLERKSTLIGLRPKAQRAQLERRHSCFDYGYKQAPTTHKYAYRARSLLTIPTTSSERNTGSSSINFGCIKKTPGNGNLENSTVVVEPIQMQKDLGSRKQIDEIVEKYESVKDIAKNCHDTMKAMQKINNLINSTAFGLNTNVPSKYRKVHQILIGLTDNIATALIKIHRIVCPPEKKKKSRKKFRSIGISYNGYIYSKTRSRNVNRSIYSYSKY